MMVLPLTSPCQLARPSFSLTCSASHSASHSSDSYLYFDGLNPCDRPAVDVKLPSAKTSSSSNSFSPLSAAALSGVNLTFHFVPSSGVAFAANEGNSAKAIAAVTLGEV